MNAAKAVLADGKSRVIVLSIAVIAILAVVIGVLKFRKANSLPKGIQSSISTGVPNIKSIPGMGDPTREYAKLQEQQNAQLAEQALAENKVALPTVVRTTYINSGVSLNDLGTVSGEGCNIDELQRAKQAGVQASELRCRGCSLDALRAAGFSASELAKAGFGATELKKAGFSTEELKLAGFNAKELLDAGFNIEELKVAGFSAADLVQAGVNVSDLVKAGFSAQALKAAGVSAKELLAAGFNSSDLFNAGFSAGELLKAGVNAAELVKAGFSAQNLLEAGLSSAELLKAGMAQDEVLKAEQVLKNLALDNYRRCDVDSLQRARQNGIDAAQLRGLGCGVEGLRAAGFSAEELKQAGFSAGELLKAGYSVADLRNANFDAQELKAAGVSASMLKAAGFSAKELLAAGYSAADLAKAAFNAQELLAAGVSLADLKDAGFSSEELLASGVSPETLLKAGFSKGDLLRAGVEVNLENNQKGLSNRCRVSDVLSLYKQNVSEKEIISRLQCTSEEVKTLLNSITVSNNATNGAGVSAYDKCSKAALVIARRSGIKAESLLECGRAALQKAGFSEEELAEITALNELTEQDKNQMMAELLAEENQSAHEQLQATLNQEASLNKLDRDNQVKTIQAMMVNQSNQLFSAWTPTNTQVFVEAIKEENNNNGSNVSTNNQTGNVTSTAEDDSIPGDTYKAGSILFATLDTAVNSDENVPVMATIVSGKLKGTKVLGNFQRVNKKVVLTFTVLSIPYLKNSINFSSVAIDPETAKAALASDVDSHYLLRFGGLMGTSFLEGLGTAFKDSGSSIQTTTTGSIITSPALTVSEKLLVATGTMASKVASENSHIADTPPTVRVTEGTSIGLLLTSDLFVPEKN